MIIFFSETDLVNKDLVTKAVNVLKTKKFAEEGYLEPPKEESKIKIGEKQKD